MSWSAAAFREPSSAATFSLCMAVEPRGANWRAEPRAPRAAARVLFGALQLAVAFALLARIAAVACSISRTLLGR